MPCSRKITGCRGRIGDLMFSMINLSRFLKVNAENSLTNATEKFINRLDSVEKPRKGTQESTDGLSVEALDKLWEEVKEQDIVIL